MEAGYNRSLMASEVLKQLKIKSSVVARLKKEY